MTHDCRQTQENLLDFAVGELDSERRDAVRREISACALCRAELDELERTFELYDSAAVEPAETEWRRYEANLLANFTPRAAVARPPSFWRRAWGASVRVPAPVFACGILLFCLVAAFFAVRPANRELNLPGDNFAAANQNSSEKILPPENQNETQNDSRAENSPVKIVVRERVVTRKIYVDKQTRTATASKTRKSAAENSGALNLAEFKPVRQNAPAVVKTNSRREK